MIHSHHQSLDCFSRCGWGRGLRAAGKDSLLQDELLAVSLRSPVLSSPSTLMLPDELLPSPLASAFNRALRDGLADGVKPYLLVANKDSCRPTRQRCCIHSHLFCVLSRRCGGAFLSISCRNHRPFFSASTKNVQVAHCR